MAGEGLSLGEVARRAATGGELHIEAWLQVASDATPGERELRLRLSYQACDSSRCLAPAALTLQASLRVEAAALAAPLRHPALFMSGREAGRP